ncbi:MAG TPA: DUF1284 domain-containing protein [Thermodesulfovibrionales bacterium]|nr:DUF1284 domain-containing protein [Thermodesulfovibrionales bacterium]
MPRLRGHHLICLRFFQGEGYSPEFVHNLTAVLNLARDGDIIEHCDGPDDICRRCPHLHDEKCRYTETAEAEVRGMDEKALSLLRLDRGKFVRWRQLRERLPEVFHEWYGLYCTRCAWKGACERDEAYRQLVREKKEG